MLQDNNSERYEYLALRWKSLTISPIEEAELYTWLNQHTERSVNIDSSTADNEQQLKEEIFREIQNRTLEMKSFRLRRHKVIRYVAAAASLILAGGAWMLYVNAYRDHKIQIGADVVPGRNSATLTLSNGKKMFLGQGSKGQIGGEDGAVIYSGKGELNYLGKDGGKSTLAYNLLQTGNAEQFKLVLADSTRVWLNAASSIRFPVDFSGQRDRVVEVDGEAYFEVSRDKNHPFIVNTTGQTVKVLGTHFDICAYRDEVGERTVLAEGSVTVYPRGIESSILKDIAHVLLRPGEQSTLKGKKMVVTKADLSVALAWTKGDFIFNDESLEEVMRQVAKWYNVEVIYDDKDMKSLKLAGSVSRARPLSAVLERIQTAIHGKFRVTEKKIFISR